MVPDAFCEPRAARWGWQRDGFVLPAHSVAICPCSPSPGRALQGDCKSEQASSESCTSAGEAALGPAFQLQKRSSPAEVPVWPPGCPQELEMGLGGSISSASLLQTSPEGRGSSGIPAIPAPPAAIPSVWDLLALVTSRPRCHHTLLKAQFSGMWPVLLPARRCEGVLWFPGLERLSHCSTEAQGSLRAGGADLCWHRGDFGNHP